MLKILFGVFIILHGFVHLLYFGHSARYFELQPGFNLAGWCLAAIQDSRTKYSEEYRRYFDDYFRTHADYRRCRFSFAPRMVSWSHHHWRGHFQRILLSLMERPLSTNGGPGLGGDIDQSGH